MPDLYYLNVTIHVVAALVWLGGIFFLAAVGAPVRGVDPALRAELFRRLESASAPSAGSPSVCWSSPEW